MLLRLTHLVLLFQIAAIITACGGGGADQDRAEEKDGLELHGEVVVVVID